MHLCGCMGLVGAPPFCPPRAPLAACPSIPLPPPPLGLCPPWPLLYAPQMHLYPHAHPASPSRPSPSLLPYPCPFPRPCTLSPPPPLYRPPTLPVPLSPPYTLPHPSPLAPAAPVWVSTAHLHASHHFLQLRLLFIQNSEGRSWLAISRQLGGLAFAAGSQLPTQPVCKLRPVELQLQHHTEHKLGMCHR